MSLAPWLNSPLSQVLSPRSLTTSTTRRRLKSSSWWNPATRCPRTCLTRNSTMRPSVRRSLHHHSLRSEKNPFASFSGVFGTQFCSVPFLMVRVSDGTDVPISPAPASSSILVSPNGSLPDLEGVGGHPTSTMKENSKPCVPKDLPSSRSTSQYWLQYPCSYRVPADLKTVSCLLHNQWHLSHTKFRTLNSLLTVSQLVSPPRGERESSAWSRSPLPTFLCERSGSKIMGYSMSYTESRTIKCARKDLQKNSSSFPRSSVFVVRVQACQPVQCSLLTPMRYISLMIWVGYASQPN